MDNEDATCPGLFLCLLQLPCIERAAAAAVEKKMVDMHWELFVFIYAFGTTRRDFFFCMCKSAMQQPVLKCTN